MPPRTTPRLLPGCTAAAAILLGGGCRLADVGRGFATGIVLPGGQAADAAETEALRGPVREAVATLLSRHVPSTVVQASLETADSGRPAAKRICIVPMPPAGMDRDEIGPRLGAIIQQRIDESDVFEAVAPRFVASGLEAARLRPADLRLADNRRGFTTFMEQQGQEIDYLLLAAIESTDDARATSRDRILVLTLVDARSGTSDDSRKALPRTGRGGLLRLPMPPTQSRPAE
jgi:hypothetical protein